MTFYTHKGKWLAITVALGVAIAALSLAFGAHRRANTSLDISDEGAHYDYALSLRQGSIPRWGDQIHQQTARLEQCLGAAGGPTGDCGLHHRITNSGKFGAEGYSYEAQQGPLGYVPYALLMHPGDLPAQALRAARRGGEVWVLLGGGVLLAVAAVAGFDPLQSVSLMSISLLSPILIHASATVNNDCAGVAGGGLVLLVWVVSRRYRRRLWIAGLFVGILVGLLKGFFFFAPAALLLWSVLTEKPWRGPERPWREWADRHGCVFTMFVGSVGSYLGWVVIQSIRARVPSNVVLQAMLGFSRRPHISFTTLLDGVQSMLSPWSAYDPTTSLYFIWDVSIIAPLLVVAIWPHLLRIRSADRRLGIALAIDLAILGVVPSLWVYLQGQYIFATPTRYAIPMLPLVGFYIARISPRPSLLVVGVGLPVIAGIVQTVTGSI